MELLRISLFGGHVILKQSEKWNDAHILEIPINLTEEKSQSSQQDEDRQFNWELLDLL